MPKFDLYDNAGRKIGQAETNSADQAVNDAMGFGFLALVSLMLVIVFLPFVAVYKISKNGKQAGIFWYVIFVLDLVGAYIIFTGVFPGVLGYLFGTCVCFGIPFIIGRLASQNDPR